VVLTVNDVVVTDNNDVMLDYHEHLIDNLDIVAYPVEQNHHNSSLLVEMMDQEIEDEYKVIILLVQHDDLMDHVEPIALLPK
jgi:hypothetical protein